ncbi:MAG: gliding motility-associated C-terminal domain-containing protein [Spirochaetaceae bacterium]|nr:gliding motility-associated C-terminal domain-containing protein [Spirochaetaceae bacterium]
MKSDLNKKIILLLFLAVFISFSAADSPKGDAGALFYDLLSPGQASSAASLVNLNSPLAAMNNPASTGFLQRATLEAAYTGVNGYGDYDGWGHIAALGFSYPGKAGVLNTSLFLINSNFDFYNSAFLTGLNISAAKDIYENLSIGAGLNLGYGKAGAADWMLSLDLGFIHYPTEFLSHRNFRWGAVLRDMGKGFSPDNFSSIPPAFTPGVGAGINVFNLPKAAGDLTANLFFPSFENVVADIGKHIAFTNSLRLNLAARANFDTLNNNGIKLSSFSPSIGLSYGFRTDLNMQALRERDWNQADFIVNAAFTQIAENIHGYGVGVRIPLGIEDREGPSINITYNDVQHISPNNFDANYKLVFPVRIEDRRFVMGYTFNIMDENGNIVRTYENKEKRPENINLRNIIDRILYVRSGIHVPAEFSWDGLGNDRQPVSDGVYSFFITAWDDNGNTSTSALYNVVVDTVPPRLNLERPVLFADMIFSPNNDGIKDYFTIRQSGSVEKSWIAQIFDNRGNAVRSFDFSGNAPVDIVWDGRGDDGLLLPDGVYSYRIEGEDFAGNRTSGMIQNIIISTIETPIELRISDFAFSPGNAGARSLLAFFMDVPVREGIESWSLDIISEKDNRVEATIEGRFVIPERHLYDGRTSAGNFLADGKYRARLRVVYIHGNRPEVYSPPFVVDTVPPSATVTAEHRVFAPGGSSPRSFLVFNMKTSPENLWEGTIFDKDNNPVRVFQWRHGVPENFSWNGTGSDGQILADGDYFFVLSSTDEAGNRGNSEGFHFTIDTADTPVALSRNFDAFSPNNDGIQDVITFFPRAERYVGIERYSFVIVNNNNEIVFRQDGAERIPERIIWDGRITVGNMAGRIIEDRYTARIDVLYLNGNNPIAVTEPFVLDITFPAIEIEIDYTLFSPDGDGNRDFVTIRMINPSYEDEWNIIITDSNNNVVRSLSQRGRPDNYIWDGRDQSGNIVRNGIYRFTVQSQDAAGNRTVRTINSIEVDTRLTQAIVSVESEGFSPNNDNYMDTIRFFLLHTNEVPVESWSLRIISSAGRTVRTFAGASVSGSIISIPETIIWDGKSETGEIIDDIYRAEFRVLYKKGDIRTSETRNFILDTTPPKVEIVLTPFPFSPDNDGVDDYLNIIIRLEDKSEIRDWEIRIRDPYMNDFRRFAGRGLPPERIIWDGMSDRGELVQAAEDYPYEFTATDIFGNSVTVSGIIAVDVLVIRDGDNLRIKISSINFAPDSPELVTDIPEIRERNERILQRLAEILNKYSTYRIKIEGHANNLSWYDPVRAEREEREELIPLSQQRCETVKRILVEKGVAADRMTTLGVGGTNPVVPFSDLENRWKNRRVEFILIR